MQLKYNKTIKINDRFFFLLLKKLNISSKAIFDKTKKLYNENHIINY